MGFLAPWFLGGLLALGVPVFVHLLKRHVTVPQPVGSLMFFERGTQSSTKHRRLKYLLLFALRTALLLLVVLAFANPFVRRAANDPAGRLLLIVLDNSYSMRAGTRFAEAKEQAMALLAAKPPSQKAQIVALGGQVQMLTQPLSDAAQLREALASIQPGDGHGSFGVLGRDMRTLGEQAHGPADLHLFSDLQRSAMPANFADMVMPAETTLTLHSVAKGAAPPNWTVASVDAPAELADPKDTKRSRVLAVIAGFNTPAASKGVSLVVNGRVAATKRVEVPANGRSTVEFSPLDIGYGFSKCEVRVDAADAFPLDDASVFAVRRSDPQRVLFVRAPGDSRSELYFGAALGAAAQASFTLQAVSAQQASDLDPSRFAFVVLDDALALPPIFERNLRDYVNKGGSVLLALGTGAGHHAQLPLLGTPVKDTREYARGAAGGAVSVGQVDFTHPAMQDAQPGRDNGGWADTKVLYAAVVDPAGSRVIARLSDGTPLLLDRAMGEGHVLVFTTGFDNLTNDFPLHPVFVAFVDRVSRYLAGTERLSGSRLVDSFLQLRSGTAATNGGSVEAVGPDGKRVLSLEEARTVQSVQLEHAGFYEVHFASGKDAVIGVNPDRLESDLQPMADDVQQLWTGSNAAPQENVQAASETSRVSTRPVSLWWYVMLLALLVAVAETALSSNYMGTQREEA